MKVGTDHLFTVDGVEAGQETSSSIHGVALLLGVCEVSWFICL